MKMYLIYCSWKYGPKQPYCPNGRGLVQIQKPSGRRRAVADIGYLNQVIQVPTGDDRVNHILSLSFYWR
jgi:hypothetical protein